MIKPLVAVVIGSRADFNIMRRGLEALRTMGVPYTFEMASAHRTPDRLMKFAREAGDNGIEVLICASGGAAHTAGLISACTNLPVIAVPIDSTPLRGQDALYSMVQMPPGTPVATVGINNGENAALLATQILALKYSRFRAVLSHRKQSLGLKVETSHAELLNEYPDLCDPTRTAPITAAAAPDDETDPGAEDITPDPPEKNGEPRTERIRPGAMLPEGISGISLTAPTPIMAAPKASQLVQTPRPHEPSSEAVTAEIDPATIQGLPLINLSREPEPPLPPARDPLAAKAPAEPPTPPLLRPVTETGGATYRLAGSAMNRGSLLPPTPIAVSRAHPTLPGSPNTLAAIETPPTISSGRAQVSTKVFEVSHEDPDEDVLTHAMMVLLEGGIVAFPTDTVYGLAVDATNADAVRALYEVKGQEAQRKSLSVLIASADMLDSLVQNVPPEIESVIEKYWPGGLTILFSKHPTVLQSVTESPSIAIRIPNDAVPLRLMSMVQRPLAVINAAFGESPAAVNAAEVMERFEGRIDCLLDAGPCLSAVNSTVLSVITEPFDILREGTVPTGELRQLLGSRLRE